MYDVPDAVSWLTMVPAFLCENGEYTSFKTETASNIPAVKIISNFTFGIEPNYCNVSTPPSGLAIRFQKVPPIGRRYSAVKAHCITSADLSFNASVSNSSPFLASTAS